MTGSLRLVAAPSRDECPDALKTRARVRLIRTRRAMGLNTAQMAQALDASESAVCKWESGKRALPGWAVERLLILQERLAADNGSIAA